MIAGHGVVGFAEKRLFGEGALRPEESDRGVRWPRLARARRCVRRPYPGRIVNIMDEPALQRLLDDVRSGACSPDEAVHPAPAPALRRPRLRQGRPPPHASPGICPRRSTDRARPPSSAHRSWASCSKAAGGERLDAAPGVRSSLPGPMPPRSRRPWPSIPVAPARSPAGPPAATRCAASCPPWSGARPPSARPAPSWSPRAPPTCPSPANARRR